jgi:hypothetical protein
MRRFYRTKRDSLWQRLGCCLLLTSVLLALAPAHAGRAAAPPLAVEHADGARVILVWRAPPLTLAPATENGVHVVKPRLAGMTALPAPGQPDLPAASLLLAIPPGATVTTAVLEDNAVWLDLPAPVAVAPLPATAVDPLERCRRPPSTLRPRRPLLLPDWRRRRWWNSPRPCSGAARRWCACASIRCRWTPRSAGWRSIAPCASRCVSAATGALPPPQWTKARSSRCWPRIWPTTWPHAPGAVRLRRRVQLLARRRQDPGCASPPPKRGCTASRVLRWPPRASIWRPSTRPRSGSIATVRDRARCRSCWPAWARANAVRPGRRSSTPRPSPRPTPIRPSTGSPTAARRGCAWPCSRPRTPARRSPPMATPPGTSRTGSTTATSPWPRTRTTGTGTFCPTQRAPAAPTPSPCPPWHPAPRSSPWTWRAMTARIAPWSSSTGSRSQT